jgi:hypothetical protein
MRKSKPLEKPAQPQSNSLQRAYEVAEYGVESANKLLSLYENITQTKGPGAPTHEEQDLLRAMLVMAAATLDATLKQLFMDAYTNIVQANEDARRKAEEHLHSQVLKRIAEPQGLRLAEALLSDEVHTSLAKLIIQDLTRGSLQSLEEVKRVEAYLGVKILTRKDQEEKLKKAFTARNQIIHEMDALFEEKTKPGGRKRRQRKKEEMVEYASTLLKVATEALQNVDNAIKSKQ